MDKIYLLIGNDTPLAVCLRKSEGEETPVPYDLSEARHLRLTLVGHGMRVCAKDIEVSGDDNNVVSGMIPGRSLLKGDYDLEVTFTLDGRDKRFAIDNMFEAVDFLAEDADGEAEGEGAGIFVTVTVQPELIEISGPAGPQGKSAYQVWLDDGHTGTEDDFFEWLAAQTPNPDWNQNDSTKADFIKNRTHWEEESSTTINDAKLAWSGSTPETLDFWLYGTDVHIPRTSVGWGLTWEGGELFIDDMGTGYELGVFDGEEWEYNPFDPSFDQQPYPLNVDVVIASETVHKLDNKYLDLDSTPTLNSQKPVTSDGVKRAMPTVPVISTNVEADGTSDSKTSSPKSVKTFVEGKGYYTKPQSGIPASDIAAGVIPTVPTDIVKYTSQSLTDAQKEQARTNIGAASDSDVSQLRSDVTTTLLTGTKSTTSASLSRPLFGPPFMEVGKTYLVVFKTSADMSFTRVIFATPTSNSADLLPNGSYTFEANKEYKYLYSPTKEGCDRVFFIGNTVANIEIKMFLYNFVEKSIQDSFIQTSQSFLGLGSRKIQANYIKGDLHNNGYIDTLKKYRVSTENYIRYDYDAVILASDGFLFAAETFDEHGIIILRSGFVTKYSIPAGTLFRITIKRKTESTSEDISDINEFANAISVSTAVIGADKSYINLFGHAAPGEVLLSSYVLNDIVSISYYESDTYSHIIAPVRKGQNVFVDCSATTIAIGFITYSGKFAQGVVNINNRALGLGDYIAPEDGWVIVNNNDSFNASPVCYIDCTDVGAFISSGYPDYNSIPILYGKPGMIDNLEQAKYDSLSLLWFSDIHGEGDQMRRIMDFAGMFRRYIDDIINTGDTVQTEYSDGISEITAVEGTDNILTIVGNHDSATKPGGVFDWYGATHLQTYQLLFGNVANWGVVQPTDAAQEGKCYWYKDYIGKGLRIVGIDAMSAAPNTSRYDPAQITWFADVLATAKTAGLSVMVLSHFVPAHTNIDCPWNNSTGYTSTPPYATLEDFADAIDAFAANGGEFVCWLAGDTHRDEFGVATNHPGQLCVVIATARLQNGTGFARSVHTKSRDLFNIISVNTTSKALKLLRVGADMDENMRRRIPLGYNYLTKSIITNY